MNKKVLNRLVEIAEGIELDKNIKIFKLMIRVFRADREDTIISDNLESLYDKLAPGNMLEGVEGESLGDKGYPYLKALLEEGVLPKNKAYYKTIIDMAKKKGKVELDNITEILKDIKKIDPFLSKEPSLLIAKINDYGLEEFVSPVTSKNVGTENPNEETKKVGSKDPIEIKEVPIEIKKTQKKG